MTDVVLFSAPVSSRWDGGARVAGHHASGSQPFTSTITTRINTKEGGDNSGNRLLSEPNILQNVANLPNTRVFVIHFCALSSDQRKILEQKLHPALDWPPPTFDYKTLVPADVLLNKASFGIIRMLLTGSVINIRSCIISRAFGGDKNCLRRTCPTQPESPHRNGRWVRSQGLGLGLSLFIYRGKGGLLLLRSRRPWGLSWK